MDLPSSEGVAFELDSNSEITDEDLVLFCEEIEQKEKRKLSDIGDADAAASKQRKLDSEHLETSLETCIVCMDNECSVMFIPCRHLETCYVCAPKLKSCPLCNSKIDETISDLSGEKELASSITKNNLIFGQAIFTADQSDVFMMSQSLFLQNGTRENICDKFYLWFPYFCNQISDTNLGFPSDVTGVIILEGLHKFGICQQQCFPIGIVLIRLDIYARNSILMQSFFTKYDLENRSCQILWFSQQDILEFANIIHKAERLTWPYLIYKARNLSHKGNQFSVLNRLCPNRNEIIRDPITLVSELQVWTERSNLFAEYALYIIQSEEKCMRHLTHIEMLWLFMHVYCRYSKKYLMTSKLFKLLLNNICLNISPVAPHINVYKVTESVVAKCVAVALHDQIPYIVENQYNLIFENLQFNVASYKEHIGDQIDRIRRENIAINFYISHKLNKSICECISNAPENVFDRKAVTDWCERMGNFIHTTFKPTQIFGSVTANLMCLNKNSNFMLYDTLDSTVEDFCNKVYGIIRSRGCSTDLNPNNYQPLQYGVMSGNLSGVALHPISKTLSYSKTKFIYKMFQNLKATHCKILESSITRTPIFRTHKFGITQYHRVVPVSMRGKSMWEIMNTYIYPETNSNLYTHEVVNYRMHVSTLVIDIDITPAIDSKPVESDMFISDLIRLAEIILDKCELGKQCLYYVFQSNKEQGKVIKYSQNEGKYGFHYHIKLPFDTVMTTMACGQFIHILNDIRHIYPYTTGIKVSGTTSNIFDESIYNERSFHSLRGPFQTKSDNTGRLECIFRSDNGNLYDIPLYHKLIHAPQIDPRSGQYVTSGRIIEKFVGVKLIRDDIFLRQIGEKSINRYA